MAKILSYQGRGGGSEVPRRADNITRQKESYMYMVTVLD